MTNGFKNEIKFSIINNMKYRFSIDDYYFKILTAWSHLYTCKKFQHITHMNRKRESEQYDSKNYLKFFTGILKEMSDALRAKKKV